MVVRVQRPSLGTLVFVVVVATVVGGLVE